MDNQDKIFDKIRAASQKAETKDFPGMEKVWARVDEKLDKKVLKTKNKLWKKIAVAASVLLLISIAYQVIKPTNEIQIIKNNIVTIDSIKKISPKPASQAITYTNIDTVKVDSILESTRIVSNKAKNRTKSNAVVMQKTETPQTQQEVIERATYNKENLKKQSSRFNRGQVYDAIVVSRSQESERVEEQAEVVSSKSAPIYAAPLVVIDGRALTSKKSKSMGTTEKEVLSNLNTNDIESLIVLKEPLYIINDIHYSEEELFGTNPTSPYAPLNKQEIESIEILQKDEAIKKYGDKGKKGAVIISTKNHKPVGQ